MKVKKSLLDEVAALGFPLMEAEKKMDANTTLAEVVVCLQTFLDTFAKFKFAV